mgnify:CR=1 FL=1
MWSKEMRVSRYSRGDITTIDNLMAHVSQKASCTLAQVSDRDSPRLVGQCGAGCHHGVQA